MSSIFAPDSAAMRFLTRIADLMILNLVFIATAIPIVTLGAALTALNFTAMRIVRGRCDAVTRDYFRSFRQNFRQATLLGLLVLLVAVALGAWYVVLTSGSLDAGAQLILLVVWYLVAFAFAVNLLFVFPYLANFEGSIREVLRNARLLSWRHPLVAIMSLAIIGLAIVVTVFYPAVTAYGLLWLAIGFAAIAFLTGVLFTRVFDAYAPQPVAVEESDEE
ncbi:DUF624 domain-containing protein [Microbacterium sp. QXD-8]|uniref:DUF624 domain-containing protein n=1 Tax=Microbacterium psychrotolerans TaxID=3068321 RepID=A0ABU0YXX2_9MICO|nr:DUF624 domain-containing protein [Microbacterium sp. QXD-8]MDQ7876449.1 DUF624 domain-containing protein [Microbacterium sp. QXD-8]